MEVTCERAYLIDDQTTCAFPHLHWRMVFERLVNVFFGYHTGTTLQDSHQVIQVVRWCVAPPDYRVVPYTALLTCHTPMPMKL
jgi:hypothetical protein